MRIIHSLDEMTETARGWLSGGSVGFVPIMGYLHEGHRTLIHAAQQECEISVVSIFLNPLQFASNEDLVNYPWDLGRDLSLLNASNVDVVFLPRTEDMFPPYFSSYVTPHGSIAQRLEGAIHPAYTRGVATVMTKLFQLVRPDVAFFGRKNAQQVAIVRQLVRDLNIDMNLRILPIVREDDGLAMSSQNFILSAAERQAATVLYRALQSGKALIESGERSAAVIENAMFELVAGEALVTLDYAAVCHPDTFSAMGEVRPEALLAIAVHIGKARLLDNFLWEGDEHWAI